MNSLLDQIAGYDGAMLQLVEGLRSAPLTVLFVVASAWWVKWPVIAAIGAARDAQQRRLLPPSALAALAAAGAAAAVVDVLKQTFDRLRPPLAEHGVSALGSIPDSPSFPSGHSATAFAAATAVGLLCPRLRLPLLALAVLVAASRVYLGVHYPSDVLVGSALGIAIGVVAGTAARAAHSALEARLGTQARASTRSPHR